MNSSPGFMKDIQSSFLSGYTFIALAVYLGWLTYWKKKPLSITFLMVLHGSNQRLLFRVYNSINFDPDTTGCIPKQYQSLHRVLQVVRTHHCTALLIAVHTNNSLNHFIFIIHHSVKPIATDFQSSFCVILHTWAFSSLFPLIKNSFLTAILLLIPFLLRLQWKIDRLTEGPSFQLIVHWESNWWCKKYYILVKPCLKIMFFWTGW